MTDHDDHRTDAGSAQDAPDWLRGVRARYNPPPEAPREEMWAVVRRGLAESGALAPEAGADGTSSGGQPAPLGADLVDLERHRRTKSARGLAGRGLTGRWPWAAAAAAILAVGIGIGRWSAPTPVGTPDAAPMAVAAPEERPGTGVELVARLHFGRTESLLATVRADARAGRMDDSVGPWARSLLTQTRLLMDARDGARDETQRLLADLELVLVQILGATETGGMDEGRAREELDLAVRSLEQGELLTRIRSAAPTTMAGA